MHCTNTTWFVNENQFSEFTAVFYRMIITSKCKLFYPYFGTFFSGSIEQFTISIKDFCKNFANSRKIAKVNMLLIKRLILYLFNNNIFLAISYKSLVQSLFRV